MAPQAPPPAAYPRRLPCNPRYIKPQQSEGPGHHRFTPSKQPSLLDRSRISSSPPLINHSFSGPSIAASHLDPSRAFLRSKLGWMEPSSSEEPPHDQLRDLLNGHSAAEPQATALVPPYWKHHRQVSDASLEFRRPPPITLEDHTESYSERSNALWAKSVTIEEHAIVKGSRTGVGAYVVWTCIVQTLDGGPMTIRKRYSEFDTLRQRLAATFPKSGQAMPALPPKSAFYKFSAKFLEKRRVGLEYFLNCVLLNPEFSGSPVLKEFLLS